MMGSCGALTCGCAGGGLIVLLLHVVARADVGGIAATEVGEAHAGARPLPARRDDAVGGSAALAAARAQLATPPAAAAPPPSVAPSPSPSPSSALAPPRASSSTDGCGGVPRTPLLLSVGIITAPSHFDRRLWIRQKLRVSDARCRGVRVFFVLGSRHRMNRRQRLAVRREERAHGDIVFVPARDWVPHAVAEKSLAWWQWAAEHAPARWYAKTDDDSLMHLPRLESDLAAMAAMGRTHHYYGVMTWRAWTPFAHEPDAACGERGDDGPSLGGPSGRLTRLIRARQPGGACAGAVGPFPFADGSLQALSADLLTALVTSPLTVNFSASHRGRTRPPFWTHEDAAVGYLLFHVAMQQQLPLTYVVLSHWKHNKFWINWFPRNNPSLPDGHVVNTHKVVTSMMAQIAADAYENTSYLAEPFKCVDCAEGWGWNGRFDSAEARGLMQKVACCNKVTTGRRSRRPGA